MQRLLREAIAQGAAGLSAGLTYAPGMYADDDELVALCTVLQGTGAAYTPHHHNYGAHAIEGAPGLDRDGAGPLPLPPLPLPPGLPAQPRPGRRAARDDRRGAGRRRRDRPRRLPAWRAPRTCTPSCRAGRWGHGRDDRAARDPDLRERLRHELEASAPTATTACQMEWTLVVTGGSSIAEAGRAVRPPAGRRVLRALRRRRPRALGHAPRRQRRAIMQHPCHTGGSSRASWSATGRTRAAGDVPAVPRRLRARAQTAAARGTPSGTSCAAGADPPPADRGLLRPGMAADIHCFDPDAVRATATYEEPRIVPDRHPARARERRPGDRRRRAHWRHAGRGLRSGG